MLNRNRPPQPDRRLQPRAFRVMYLLAFMGSLDFHMEFLYPLRHQYDAAIPDNAKGIPPMMQLIFLTRKVMINLPAIKDGEREDLYKLVGEDVRRHYPNLSFEDNKEYIKMSVDVLEIAMIYTDIADVQKLAEAIARKVGGT